MAKHIPFQYMCEGFVVALATEQSSDWSKGEVIRHYYTLKRYALEILRQGIVNGEVAPDIVAEIDAALTKENK